MLNDKIHTNTLCREGILLRNFVVTTGWVIARMKVREESPDSKEQRTG